MGAGRLPGAGRPASGAVTDFWLPVGTTVCGGGLRHEAWSEFCSEVGCSGVIRKIRIGLRIFMLARHVRVNCGRRRWREQAESETWAVRLILVVVAKHGLHGVAEARGCGGQRMLRRRLWANSRNSVARSIRQGRCVARSAFSPARCAEPVVRSRGVRRWRGLRPFWRGVRGRDETVVKWCPIGVLCGVWCQ